MKKYLLILLIPFLAFTFTGNPPGGWYQQFIPDVGGMPISDMEFLDSLTGFIITDNNTGGDTGYVLKTTNGGDNWNIVFKERRDFTRIIFLNDSVGYTCGGNGTGTPYLYKTINSGVNWVEQNVPSVNKFEDMSVLNEDTIWLVDDNGLNGGVFRTTNGGINWTTQYFDPGTTPKNIYMYNGMMGFFSTGNKLFKTTNSGIVWDTVAGENGFLKMHFIDPITGWKAGGNMKKTTDGGDTWLQQTLPPVGGIILVSAITDFINISNDTIWGVGGTAFLGPGQFRGLIFTTTNGGNNWQYQLPDTNIHIGIYSNIDFADSKKGWAYSTGSGIHTTEAKITSIEQVNYQSQPDFKLLQNYPNPFNSGTIINYELRYKSYVKLQVFDVTGKLVQELVNKEQLPGNYNYTFDGANLTSGLYFYQLKTDKFIDTKKMILLK